MIARVLAIPPKRFERRLVTFLTEPEVEALLAAPDRTTWTGRRDHALLALAVQTGLRVSELIGLRSADVHLGAGRARQLPGQRTQATDHAADRGTSSRSCASGSPSAPATRATRSSRPAPGTALSRDAARAPARRVRGDAAVACPSLREKTITLTCCGTPPRCDSCTPASTPSVIALWLGHEQVETTQIYLHADLALKERALAQDHAA